MWDGHERHSLPACRASDQLWCLMTVMFGAPLRRDAVHSQQLSGSRHERAVSGPSRLRSGPGGLRSVPGKGLVGVRKAIAHADSLRRAAESAKEPVCELEGFGLSRNDHVGMRQHSGVFVSGVIRSSSCYPSESRASVARDNIPRPVGLKETKPYQRVDLATKGASVFHIPLGAR